MLEILLACNAGMSTSLLVNKMKKVAEELKLEAHIFAVPESDAERHFDNIHVLMLGPQVKYMEEKMRVNSADRFPVLTIDTQKYGTMDGKAVLRDAILAIKAFRK